MRRDVRDLRRFYATPAGRLARDLLSRKLLDVWGECAGLDLLGLGYATPVLGQFPSAHRCVAAMPGQQGVEVWPSCGPNRASLVDELALPFPNALFDRLVLAHALEEARDPSALLAEAARVMSASGRMIIMAAARGGLWAGSEKTPFGYGQPYSRTQLESLVREADLEPTAWSYALYAPPFAPFISWAETLEGLGSRLWPLGAGVILIEAVKRTYLVKPRGQESRVLAQLSGVLGARPGTVQPVGFQQKPFSSRDPEAKA